MNTTYNAKVVNRIDRVLLVLTIIASAALIFAGANAGQDAQASTTQGAHTSIGEPQYGSVMSHNSSGGNLSEVTLASN